MKKIILFLIIFLTGCQNYNELNNLAIIKSIGIKKDNDYYLYAEIIDEIDKDNKPKKKIIEIKDKEIEKLFQNIKTTINKEIHLSHIDLIILDEKLHDEDYHSIINYFIKQKEFRNDFLTIISDDIKKVMENTKYDEIERLIITNKENKKIIKISFEEIIKDFLDYQEFNISKIIYDNKILFEGNYQYKNNHLERITNEK